MDSFTVKKIEAWPANLPLKASFVVATGAMDVAQNIFIRVTLTDGSLGIGEVAPFTDISGEDQASCLARFPTAAEILLGQSALQFRRISNLLRECTENFPALRCGLETALLDALCHSIDIPLWALWGGADLQPRETDVTLPIGPIDTVVNRARDWYQQGFRLLKMKVGHDVEEDIRRIEAVAVACEQASFVIDANQGYTLDQAQAFLKSMEQLSIPVKVFEQPIHRNNLEDLVMLKKESNIPLAADESLRSIADAYHLIKHKAVDIFNLKIAKCGVMESVHIAALAQASGVGLMIGGMVESRVTMGCSWSLVLGLGGIEILDLDMPLLLSIDPIHGGYYYEGPVLHPWYESGLGMVIQESSQSVVVID